MLPAAAVQSQPALGQGGSLPGDFAHLGFARGPAGAMALPQQPGIAPQLQLNEGLLASHVASTGPSPAGSVSGTPRTGSFGGASAGSGPVPDAAALVGASAVATAAAHVQQPANGGLGGSAPTGRPWSSLDGMPRPPTAGAGPSPSDGILQSSQPFLGGSGGPGSIGNSIQRPPSTGMHSGASSLQMSPSGSTLDLSQGLDGALARLPASLQAHAGGVSAAMLQHQQQQQLPRAQTLPNGLTPAQQQLLLQHHLQQQAQQQQQAAAAAQQGLMALHGGRTQSVPGLSGLPHHPQNAHPQNASLANLQAAAQAAQAAQAAAMRQQLHRTVSPLPVQGPWHSRYSCRFGMGARSLVHARCLGGRRQSLRRVADGLT